MACGHLVQVAGTPLNGKEPLDRLSAGRRELGEAVQALCFLAGANSIFYGDKLLTTGNPEAEDDRALLAKLGLRTRAEAGAAACGDCSRASPRPGA
jgi:biotin synthase